MFERQVFCFSKKFLCWPLVSAIVLILLSFVANGDVRQLEEGDLWYGIGEGEDGVHAFYDDEYGWQMDSELLNGINEWGAS